MYDYCMGNINIREAVLSIQEKYCGKSVEEKIYQAILNERLSFIEKFNPVFEMVGATSVLERLPHCFGNKKMSFLVGDLWEEFTNSKKEFQTELQSRGNINAKFN